MNYYFHTRRLALDKIFQLETGKIYLDLVLCATHIYDIPIPTPPRPPPPAALLHLNAVIHSPPRIQLIPNPSVIQYC